jgi:hypothetical protein
LTIAEQIELPSVPRARKKPIVLDPPARKVASLVGTKTPDRKFPAFSLDHDALLLSFYLQ